MYLLSLYGALLFLKLYCIIIFFSAIFHLFKITAALKKCIQWKVQRFMFLTKPFYNLNVKYLLLFIYYMYQLQLICNLVPITDNLHNELLFSLIILINWSYVQFQVALTFILFINTRTVFFF